MYSLIRCGTVVLGVDSRSVGCYNILADEIESEFEVNVEPGIITRQLRGSRSTRSTRRSGWGSGESRIVDEFIISDVDCYNGYTVGMVLNHVHDVRYSFFYPSFNAYPLQHSISSIKFQF